MTDTKPFDVTKRCQHCGGLRKEHGTRAPYKCPTRLSEDFWTPWTLEAYEQAEQAAAAKAAVAKAGTATPCPFCRIVHRVTVPSVHMNGTKDFDLLNQLVGAVEGLRLAQRNLMLAAPNGRDYYPQGQEAMQRVMDQHERRCQDLHRMLTELEEMRDHVQEVVNFETERRDRDRAAREVL
jgi:hypothetical protein